ncbi:zinc ribbon domain-containing protein [Pseudonocardia sp.]|uniref:zinc ribbon domain-containing protein n=1 Tax=Pseudonocardia sp. TaxID=60912 RepID=UPI0031FCDC98
MAQVEYRCAECGAGIAALPLGRTGAARTWPACGWSRRRWIPPSLSLMDEALVRHRLREEVSWNVPEVVTSIRPTARRRPSSVLRLAALPLP